MHTPFKLVLAALAASASSAMFLPPQLSATIVSPSDNISTRWPINTTWPGGMPWSFEFHEPGPPFGVPISIPAFIPAGPVTPPATPRPDPTSSYTFARPFGWTARHRAGGGTTTTTLATAVRGDVRSPPPTEAAHLPPLPRARGRARRERRARVLWNA